MHVFRILFVWIITLVLLSLLIPNKLLSQELEELPAEVPGVISGSVAWIDIDSDGYKDIIVSGKNVDDNPVTNIYKNIRGNEFVKANVQLADVWLSSVKVCDIDNDGDDDIFLTGATNTSPPYNPVSYIYLNNGGGNFQRLSDIGIPGIFASGVDCGDLDNDGKTDILITGKTSQGNPISAVYKNAGNFNYLQTNIDLVDVWFGSAAMEDYDGDGKLDIVLTGRGANNSPVAALYKNTGEMNMSRQSNINITPVDYSCVGWIDYNQDGNPDMFVTGRDANKTPVTEIYTNDGSGGFSRLSNTGLPSLMAGNCAWGNFNDDNLPDILVSGMDGQKNPAAGIYINNGARSFSPKDDIQLPGVTYSSVALNKNSEGGYTILLAGQASDNALISEVIKLATSYKAQFTVVNQKNSNPIENASIRMNNEKVSVSAKGEGAISAKKGNYDFVVTAPGFSQYNGEVSLNTDDVTKTISLHPVSTAKITITNTQTEKRLKGINVKIGENIYRTNKNGEITVDTLADSYTYRVVSDDFLPENGTIELEESEVQKSLSLEPLNTLTFELQDAHNGEPVTNQQIEIENSEFYTNENGIVSIDTVSGNYTYVTGGDSYKEKSGRVKIENSDRNKTIELTPYYFANLTFKNKKTDEPAERVIFDIGEKRLISEKDGKVAFDTLRGTYNYKISGSEYVNKTGKLKINERDFQKTFQLTPLYRILFVVKDQASGESIKGAEIYFSGRILTTNNYGHARIDTLSGKYRYRVIVDDEEYQSQRIEITDSDKRVVFEAQ